MESMNYLAHAWLSGPHPEWIVGGFLGDHVRGGDWADYPPQIACGILLHRRVDGFVDRHPAFHAARRCFDKPYRRYAGILLDLANDHLLARHWTDYAEVPLEGFSATCHRALDNHWQKLPRSLQRFTLYARRHGLPAEYRSPRVLEQALKGISTRLSRPNPLDNSWSAIASRLQKLERAFRILFPEVIEFAEHQRQELAESITAPGGRARS